LLVFALTIASKAGASAASRLLYTRTPGAAHCPDERRFRAAVAERLGYDPFFPWAEQTITVDIFEERGSLRAKLALVDRDGIMRGARVLKGRSRDCEELLTSLALAASITLDPMAAQTSTPPTAERDEPSTRTQTSAPPALEASVPPSDSASPPGSAQERPPSRDGGGLLKVRGDAPARVQWSLLAGPIVALGATPGASLGGRLGAQLQNEHLAFGLELRGALPTSQESDGGGTVHAGMVGGAMTPCLVEGWLYACGVLVLGSMQMRGSEVEIPVERSLWFAAAGARGEVAIPMSDAVDVRAHVDGMKALLLSQLYLHGTEVWQSPSFWAALGVSASVRIP
jgi:hypothetical protein